MTDTVTEIKNIFLQYKKNYRQFDSEHNGKIRFGKTLKLFELQEKMFKKSDIILLLLKK